MALEVQGEATYLDLLARARADPAVLGVVLTGSRGRGVFVRSDSDWDVRLFVDDVTGVRDRFETAHGSAVEAVVVPYDALDRLADPASSSAWDRYSYVHATVAFDRTDGDFERSIAEMETLAPDTGRAVAAAALDDYINSYVRSLKNERVGLTVESLLDAGESIDPLLTTLFAVHGRVRPFNKFLGWELETHPLPGDGWTASRVLARLATIQSTGAVRDQAELFRDVEALARDAGYGDVVDSWEPDVPWLRSGVARD